MPLPDVPPEPSYRPGAVLGPPRKRRRRRLKPALVVAGLLTASIVIPPLVVTDEAPRCHLRARTVLVTLDYPEVWDHAHDAVKQGQPRVLHIDRDNAVQHRRASLRGIPTRKGLDRDEYPPAVAKEGGRGADVRYVESGENRAAGASMGNQLERWCDGQRFAYRGVRSR